MPGPRTGARRIDWRNSLDVPRVALGAIIVVNISSIQLYMGPLARMRPALLGLAMTVAYMVAKPKLGSWNNLRQAWPAKAVAALGVIGCASVLFGISLGGAAHFMLEVYGRNLIFFFFLVAAIRNVRDLYVLMWSFVIAVGMFIFLALTILGFDTGMGSDRLSGGMGMFDANDMGMICLMALPLGMLLFKNSGPLGRVIATLVMIGVPVTVAFTGSRGALLGLLTLTPLMLIAMKDVSVPARLGVVVVGVIGIYLAAPPGYWDRMETLTKPTEDYNYVDEYGRLTIAKRGVGYMLQHPFFGIGVSNFSYAEGTISPIARQMLREGRAVRWIAPHNTYVEIGSEMGVPALLIWLTLLYGGTLGLLKLRKRIPPSWEREGAERKFLRQATLYLPLCFWAFALPSFFLSHTYTVILYIPIAFMCGLLVMVPRELGGSHAVAGPRRRGGAHRGTRPARRAQAVRGA